MNQDLFDHTQSKKLTKAKRPSESKRNKTPTTNKSNDESMGGSKRKRTTRKGACETQG